MPSARRGSDNFEVLGLTGPGFKLTGGGLEPATLDSLISQTGGGPSTHSATLSAGILGVYILHMYKNKLSIINTAFHLSPKTNLILIIIPFIYVGWRFLTQA